ncbi:type IV pilus assembly protein PilM [Parafrigoribacterium soli]|uniref:type IV pilus assembly protein PilM n=1 Tax=Parafrigoribacterium soli TaxID=3144663 RepID=UPI0032EDC511
MGSTIVGIDIGSTTLRAVEVQGAAKAKPLITRYHEIALPEGSVRRGEVLEVSTVADALRKLWVAGGFKSKDVVLGIGGQRVFARDLAVPRAPLAEIRESLSFHVQELLPVPVDDAILDFYPISEDIGADGPVVNGLLIAAIKEAVTSNVAAVTQAGLHPVHVDLIPFALTRALSPISSNTGLSVLIGVGANTTNVIIAQGGVPLFVRILASGGDDITRSMTATLQIDAVEAEALKRQLGLASIDVPLEQRPAVEIIYAVVGELFNSIRNTLNYFLSTKRGAHLDRVIVSGGGTQLAGFTSALAEMIGLPVAHADLLGGTPLARGVSASTDSQQQDAMSTAFGLALGTSA